MCGTCRGYRRGAGRIQLGKNIVPRLELADFVSELHDDRVRHETGSHWGHLNNLVLALIDLTKSQPRCSPATIEHGSQQGTQQTQEAQQN